MDTLTEKSLSPHRTAAPEPWANSGTSSESSVDELNRLGRILWDAASRARATHDGRAAMAGEAANSPAVQRTEREWLWDAECAYRQAVSADPTSANTHRRLGNVLLHAGKFGEAIETLKTAARLAPDNLDIQVAVADVQRAAGDYPAAVDTLEQILARDPTHPGAHQNLFATLYIQGAHARAWAEYEWRLKTYATDFPQPLWDGSPLRGRSILLHAEQGLGDQIQFIRFAPLIKERGGHLVVKCSQNLHRLMLTCDGVDQVVPPGNDLPSFDYQIWPCSLPHVLGTTQESIPAGVPYLHADPQQVTRWQTILGRFPGLRIGIQWAGNRDNVAGLNREIPLSCFFLLTQIPGVQLFSLQKGAGSEALDDRPEDLTLPSLGPYFNDLQDTAAAITALDMVITNDTSIAHLAGALGKPVWVVLPRQECWRWQRGRDDCLWYPTMRLFRRGWDASWGETFTVVHAALTEALARPSTMIPSSR